MITHRKLKKELAKWGAYLVIILLVIFLLPHKGYSKEDKKLFSQAVEAARRGERLFAFMRFRSFLRAYPESKFSKEVLFATGEYYFSIDDYYDAQRVFVQFISNYPESGAKPFALAYLLKIAEKQKREEQAENLKKQILKSKQIVLLFKDLEEHEYISALSKKYRILYFIDKIEIYIDNELFTKISF